MGLEHLTAIRRLVCEMAWNVVRDTELAARLALATHELLENALKYSLDPGRQVTLELCVDVQRNARVTVLNPSSERLYLTVRELLRQLNEALDPSAYYQRMIESSMQCSSGSGLGLARIRAEADMKLSCDFRGDVLSVRAETAPGDGP